MILSGKHKINFNIAILPIAISVILLCAEGCQQHSKSVSRECRSTAIVSVSTSACIDVEGKVLGCIKPCSKVYLYWCGWGCGMLLAFMALLSWPEKKRREDWNNMVVRIRGKRSVISIWSYSVAQLTALKTWLDCVFVRVIYNCLLIQPIVN